MRIAKPKLSKELADKSLKTLFLAVKKIHTVKDMDAFLNNNFTADEKHALLRRTAALHLLVQGKTYQEIRKLLEVSRNTISNARDMMLGRGYGRNPERHRIYESLYKPKEEKQKPMLKRKYKGASSIF